MAKKGSDATADPDKLVRQQAGTYRTTDDRFEVREADTGWFLVDTTQANEFGQELMLGPFGTLKAVREAIPEARVKKAAAARPATKSAAKSSPRSKKTKSEPAPSPPPTWIERLSKAEAAEVRKLIGALEREGITDSEALVRRDREGLFPVVAARLIEARLEAIVEEASPKERDRARQLVRRAAAVLSTGRTGGAGPLPGWTLVEIGPDREPRNRRIAIGDDRPT